jgi:hypothetical protein
MPFAYNFQFSPSDRVEIFYGSANLYYRLTNGTRMRLDAIPVWCHPCGGIREGERIETLGEIDRQLAKLQGPAELMDLRLRKSRSLRRRLISDAVQRRLWRVSRQSPGRCLSCGSTNVIVFRIHQPVPNPSGPGTIVMRVDSVCRTINSEQLFTPEGERISDPG